MDEASAPAAMDDTWEEDGPPVLQPSSSLSSIQLLKRKHNIRRGAYAAPMGPPPFFTVLAAVGFLRRKRASVDIEPPASAPKDLTEARATLSDVKADDWSRRRASIVAVPSLLAALEGDELRRELDSLADPVVLQLCDLRSAIVRSACDMLCELASKHGAAIAPLVAAVLPQLQSNLCLLKVVAQPSAECANTLLSAAPSIAALKVLLESAKDPHKQVRRGAYAALALVIALDGFVVPPKGLAAVLKVLGTSAASGRGVTDSDAPTRAAAARVYWAAAARYEGKQTEAWLGKLEAKERKLVDKYKPQ